jgi:hypothetical protein
MTTALKPIIHELIFVAPADVRPGDEVMHGVERAKLAKAYERIRSWLRTPMDVLLISERKAAIRRARSLSKALGEENYWSAQMKDRLPRLPTKIILKGGLSRMGQDLKLHGPNFRRTLAIRRLVVQP